MTWQEYQLDNTILKTTEVLTLCRTERGVIEISANSLAIPIKLGNQIEGYVFHGHGKLLLDTIVETKEGAVGKPVDREINEPFIMLGNTEEIQRHLDAIGKEDVTETRYENEQDFITKAEDLLDQFLGQGRIPRHQCCGNNYGFICAFSNKSGELDLLIVNNSKLVYKATDTVFVSNKNKVVMKTLDKVVLSHNGRSFAIGK